MSDLYLPAGWPDIEYIDAQGCPFNVLLGGRQIGKTFSVLKYLIENKRKHIFTRRTRHELATIATRADMNPYNALLKVGIRAMLTGSPDKTMDICGYTIEDGTRKPDGIDYGAASSLREIATVRGFDGSSFSDWVFDEFIPEKIVTTRKAEGDAFLNAHITISGNREIEGIPPLKVWLLANTNSINSPILNALNITDDILYMRRKGLESFKMDERGIFIAQFKSEKIMEQRKQTALFKAIGSEGAFYDMAVNAEWSYDESPYIRQMPLKNMQPCFSYDDKYYCWQHAEGFYICRAAFNHKPRRRYAATEADRARLYRDCNFIVPYYYADMCSFSDLHALAIFRQIFNVV